MTDLRRRLRNHSLRFRLFFSISLHSCLITLVAGLVIVGMSYRYLIDNCHDVQEMLFEDLRQAYSSEGVAQFRAAAIEAEMHAYGRNNVFLALVSGRDGRVLASSDGDARMFQRIMSRVVSGAREFRIRSHIARRKHTYLTVRGRVERLADGNLLVVALNATEYETFFFWMVGYTSAAFVFVLVASLVGAIVQARRVARPLKALAQAAGRIAEGHLDERVRDGRDGRELSALVAAFNAMCDANEKSMRELKVLTDDIAHDLRTPLTHLIARADVARGTSGDGAALAGDVAEEARAMLDMINTMLQISRSEYEVLHTPRERLDVGALVSQCLELYRVVAEDRGIALVWREPAEPVFFSGHKGRLQQVIGNLVDNALKFTPSGGAVTVALERTSAGLVFRVTDTGCGIPEAERPFVFRRFWRGDASRSKPGNGLGLSLVHAVVTSYGGRVTVAPSAAGGSVFEVRL